MRPLPDFGRTMTDNDLLNLSCAVKFDRRPTLLREAETVADVLKSAGKADAALQRRILRLSVSGVRCQPIARRSVQ